MGKPTIFFIFLVILVLLFQVFTLASKSPKVGIFYYVWYDNKCSNRHWNDTTSGNVVDKPLVGYYSSQNEKIIRYHLNQIKKASIDFIVISWWGINSYEDNTTKLVFKNALWNHTGVKIAIMVEPFNGSNNSNYNYTQIYNYIYDEYVSKYPNIYFKWHNKPLLLFYNPLRPSYFDSRFIIRVVGHEDYVDWLLWHPDPEKAFNRKDGFLSVFGRYDDFYLNRSNPMRIALHYEKFDDYMKFILKHKDEINIVLIYSWNEYHERSAIEPHFDIQGLDPYYAYNKSKQLVQILKNKSQMNMVDMRLLTLVLPN